MQLRLTYLLVVTYFATVTSQQFSTLKERHKAQLLPAEGYRYISTLKNTDYIQGVLDNILIPRVVGTENHTKVRKYLINELNKLNWDVEIDEFVTAVPIFGQLTMANIIATPNPNADRFLVLACHYDSKYFARDYFVGATDSAVPCAMLLDIAKSLNPILKRSHSLSIKLIFFDGEEAFENWGPNDSIYGAKHLAQGLQSKSLQTNLGEMITDLDKIDVLVLLDLIGAKDPVFYSHFDNTQRWFSRLVSIEKGLHDLGLLKQHRRNYFQKGGYAGAIEDDHLPFLRRGVPILHLIATPFPREWHTPLDNIDIVDFNTVENLSLILKIFVAEYLNLSVPDDVLSESCFMPFLVFVGAFLMVFAFAKVTMIWRSYAIARRRKT